MSHGVKTYFGTEYIHLYKNQCILLLSNSEIVHQSDKEIHIFLWWLIFCVLGSLRKEDTADYDQMTVTG